MTVATAPLPRCKAGRSSAPLSGRHLKLTKLTPRKAYRYDGVGCAELVYVIENII